MMQNPETGIVKRGFYGFSWTTLFFSGFPAFFRGDIITGVCVLIASCLTGAIAQIIWAFMYNRFYTLKLVEHGYRFIGGEQEVLMAKNRLGVMSAG